jgi:predicted DsbA family dithiol-disulfide isomerase
MKNQKMKVEIWSDIMCPFCYIGKRHYEAALKQFEYRDNVETEWKSYQLDPSIPREFHEKTNVFDYLAKRKGITRQQSEDMHKHVTEMAKNAGLDYRFDRAIVANSFRAHRIIQLAKTKGFGDQIEELFFRSYFTEGKDLGNDETLVNIGKEAGLNETEIRDELKNNAFSEAVDADIEEANNVGVRGVPFFVFNRKYGISGAQPIEAFLETFQKSYEDWLKEKQS